MIIYQPNSHPVIHADETWLVVDKPHGLPAVPGRGADLQDCLSARVQASWPDALVVHRLDMATSGLVLFARGADVQRRLSQAFAERRVEKEYVAVVHGLVEADEGRIDLPLAADWPNRPRQVVDRQRGKPSLTRWRVLSRDPSAQRTRLLLMPLTGRSHQLRVHLLAGGHGIVGDRLYGSAADTQEPRLLLHASRLALQHPVNGHDCSFESPAPF